MSKQLLVLRHAKSDWGSASLSDHQRPLSSRGINDARRMGKWIAEQQLCPDRILCSTAQRARQTLELVTQSFDRPHIDSCFMDELYMASKTTLLELIRATPASVQRLLVVGHNFGLEELVIELAQEKPDRTSSGKLFTTANLAVFELTDDYHHLQKHSANLIAITRPGEI